MVSKKAFFLILLTIIFLTGCAKSSKKEEIPKYTSLDTNYMESLCVDFLNQEVLFGISRVDLNELILDSEFTDIFGQYVDTLKKNEEWLKLFYGIDFLPGNKLGKKKTKLGSNIQIEIEEKDKETEKEYWHDKFGEITTIENLKLKDILTDNDFSKDLFLRFIDCLISSDYYSISKITGRDYIMIRTKIYEGYVYNPVDDSEPIITDATVIKKLTKNLYYFSERVQ